MRKPIPHGEHQQYGSVDHNKSNTTVFDMNLWVHLEKQEVKQDNLAWPC